MTTTPEDDPLQRDNELLAAIQARLPEARELLESVQGEWVEEDGVYRFYHQSFKVYLLQRTTERIAAFLQSLAPERPLHVWFTQIVREGTGKTFTSEHNARWLEETRPIVEAFYHALSMLRMVCKYGQQLEEAPETLPFGWAAVLELYGIR